MSVKVNDGLTENSQPRLLRLDVENDFGVSDLVGRVSVLNIVDAYLCSAIGTNSMLNSIEILVELPDLALASRTY